MSTRLTRFSHALFLSGLTCLLAPAARAEEEVVEDPDMLKVGGALRLNAFLKTWSGEEDNRNRGGDVAFDTFRLNVDARLSKVLLSAEYRLYSGYSMLHHGWVGYEFTKETQLQLGVHRVPFGALPYASHSWFFSLPYYMGMEDDYDMGLKLVHTSGPWDLQFAFYKGDEGNFTGRSTDSARYSYDVVQVNSANPGEAYLGVDSANHESNKVNARAAYTFQHGDLGRTEVGVSAQTAQIYNSVTRRNGLNWAGAVHLDGYYGPFNLRMEVLSYGYDLKNPEGHDDSIVTMGAYDAPYKMATRGTVYVAGLAYDVPVAWGPVTKLTFYESFSLFDKANAEFETSMQNVLGMLVTAGPVYTYVDVASGKNQPWLGPAYGNALAEGDPNASWDTRFNINVGYYF
nr:hypothetical protein [Myxococcus sp. AM010]